MNPSDPASFNHTTELLSTGRSYHFVDQKPEGYDPASTLTILCVHGFPDCWYGWRHQIRPWVERGFRVVVPDMLGYGGTDKPQSAEAYTTKKLSDDLAALLDVVGVKRTILLGHDWGSYTVGRFALWHADRLLALGMFSIPWTPPLKRYIPLEAIVQRIPNYSYQLYFSKPETTPEVEGQLDRFLRLLHGALKAEKPMVQGDNMKETLLGTNPSKPPSRHWSTDEDFAYYASQLQNMNGPLNYYRTTKFRFDEEIAADLPSKLRDDLPVLFIWGSKDMTTPPERVEVMKTQVARLEAEKLEGVGHWVMQEAKEDVTAKVLEWLGKNGLSPQISTKL